MAELSSTTSLECTRKSVCNLTIRYYNIQSNIVKFTYHDMTYNDNKVVTTMLQHDDYLITTQSQPISGVVISKLDCRGVGPGTNIKQKMIVLSQVPSREWTTKRSRILQRIDCIPY